MKYVSLDIETGGLAPTTSLLMVSMIVEDTKNLRLLEELPHFTCYLKPNNLYATYEDNYRVEPFAASMHKQIWDELSGKKEPRFPILTNNELVTRAFNFLFEHFGNSKIIAAGKNVARFDIPRLPILLQDKFAHRSIDPGTVFIDWNLDGPMSLPAIKKMLGLEEKVTHDAYEDALDVIEVLRFSYTKDSSLWLNPQT